MSPSNPTHTITYRQAASMLGCAIGTIHQAVSKKNLTKVLAPGREGRLVRKQVELFVGKQIRLNMLDGSERAIWGRCQDEANAPALGGTPAQAPLEHCPKRASASMNELEKVEVPQGNPFSLEHLREKTLRKMPDNGRIALKNQQATPELMRQNQMLLTV